MPHWAELKSHFLFNIVQSFIQHLKLIGYILTIYIIIDVLNTYRLNIVIMEFI